MVKVILWYLIIGVGMFIVNTAYLAFLAHGKKVPSKECEKISEEASRNAYVMPWALKGTIIGKIMFILMCPILEFKWLFYCIHAIDEYKRANEG